MKNKIRLVALDLDGTVLHSDNTLSAEMRSVIERVINNGVEVAVASGRPFGSMHPEILRIPGLRYVIASNGAAVYENGRRIFSQTLKTRDVERLMELTADHDLIWEAFRDGEICTDSRYYADPLSYGCGEAYIDYVRSSRDHCGDMRGYIIKNKSALDSVEFVCTDDKLRAVLREQIEAEIPGLYVTSSSRNFVEFTDREATKSNGLKFLCRRLSVPLKNTAAAGNADNDVDMLREAGIGIAVKNATENCLNAADIITDSNDNDGLAALALKIL